MEPLSLGFHFVAHTSKWWERYVFIVPKWNYVVLEEIEKLWAFSRYSRQCSSSRFECSETWPNDIETFRIIYRWKGMEVYFLLQFMEWHFNVCRKSYGQWSDQRSETDNNRVALFWWSLWRFQNQSKRSWNITNNIPLERYGCLVCPEFYKTQFETLCKKLWS